MNAIRILLLCGASSLGLAFGSSSLRASEQDISSINATPCELFLKLYYEGAQKRIMAFGDTQYDPASRKSILEGYLNIINSLWPSPGDFGLPEAAVLELRLKVCAEKNVKSDYTQKTNYMGLWLNFQQVMRNKHDYFGANKVEQKRADAKRQRADAEREQRERSAREATEKQANEQTRVQAGVMLDQIHGLSESGDLRATYNEIATLSDRIKQLPPDVKSDLQDALQIAAAPIDRRRNAIFADLQRMLLEIRNLPDNEEKLHRLGELAKSVQAVPESEAATLAGVIETTRDATRVKINESANAPDAATLAETDKLKVATEDERAKQRASDDAASVARAEADKLKARAVEATQRVAIMVGLFSVAKVCAEDNLIYDDRKVDIIKSRILEFINANKIPKDQVDNIWRAVQGQLATTPIKDSDCAALGSDIVAVFGGNVFDGISEKSPF
jgi:hypothetical protein